MKVIDLLSTKGTEVFSIGSENTVYEAIKKMSDLSIGALLVMENDRVEGIISERDYRDKVILKGRRSKNTPVKEIMTVKLITVQPNDDIKVCMKLMTEHKIRHLPVLNKGTISGMISIGDVVKSVIGQQKVEIKSLRNYISGGAYPG